MLTFLGSNFKLRRRDFGDLGRQSPLLLLCERQYLRALGGYAHRMLGMGRRLAVSRNDRPSVIQRPWFRGCQYSASARSRSSIRPGSSLSSRPAIIRYLRRLVHSAADPVAGVVANDAITVLFRMLLNDGPDIADPLVRPALLQYQVRDIPRSRG